MGDSNVFHRYRSLPYLVCAERVILRHRGKLYPFFLIRYWQLSVLTIPTPTVVKLLTGLEIASTYVIIKAIDLVCKNSAPNCKSTFVLMGWVFSLQCLTSKVDFQDSESRDIDQ